MKQGTSTSANPHIQRAFAMFGGSGSEINKKIEGLLQSKTSNFENFAVLAKIKCENFAILLQKNFEEREKICL